MPGVNLTMLRPRRGTFPNGMAYARLGDGPKTLLWLSGATRGPMLAMMTRVAVPFASAGYTLWLVSTRPNMPVGRSLAAMAADYTGLIDEQFGGRVDLVIGHSTGGLIGFCLAAGHPGSFAHTAIAGAGLWNERSDQANPEFSRLLVAGRTRAAGERAVRPLAPDTRVPGLAPLLGVLVAWGSLSTASAQDLLGAAEVMHQFDPQDVLPRTGVPVLLVVSDDDMYLDTGEAEQAAHLIPSCTLRIYPHTNHFGAITSPKFAPDALEFIRQHQPAPPTDA